MKAKTKLIITLILTPFFLSGGAAAFLNGLAAGYSEGYLAATLLIPIALVAADIQFYRQCKREKEKKA